MGNTFGQVSLILYYISGYKGTYFVLQGTFGKVRRHFLLSCQGIGDATSSYWIETRDTAQRHTGQHPEQRISWSKLSIVPQLRQPYSNPILDFLFSQQLLRSCPDNFRVWHMSDQKDKSHHWQTNAIHRKCPHHCRSQHVHTASPSTAVTAF